MTRILFASLLMLGATAAGADEAAVRRLLQDKMPGASIESVQKLPSADLYEVVMRAPEGPAIYYVDSGASLIFAGQVFEAKSGRNLTQERQRKLNTVKWSSLPFDSAVTTCFHSASALPPGAIRPRSLPRKSSTCGYSTMVCTRPAAVRVGR